MEHNSAQNRCNDKHTCDDSERGAQRPQGPGRPAFGAELETMENQRAAPLGLCSGSQLSRSEGREVGTICGRGRRGRRHLRLEPTL